MSLARELIPYGLKPLPKHCHAIVGAEKAKNLRLAMVGSLYLQARGIRPAKVSFSPLPYRVRPVTYSLTLGYRHRLQVWR